MKDNLLTLADAFGNAPLSAVMRDALTRPLPGGAGASEALKFFGDKIEEVQAIIAPTILAVDEMLPGFRTWLNTSGYGDDRYMIVALMQLTACLQKLGKPVDNRRKIPKGIDRPVVLQ
jgi:hypothetical protein